MNRIRKQEAIYWEERYFKSMYECDNIINNTFLDDRLYPRYRYFISQIRGRLNKQTKVLEIGGGSFKTVSVLLPPSQYKYKFIGTDFSLSSLRLGRARIQTGIFVQCDVELLPFGEESFDIIFSFGVLHHTISLEKNILKLCKLLKRGGLLIIHEPVEWKNKRKNSFLRKINNIIFREKHHIAPLQQKLNIIHLLPILFDLGNVKFLKYEYTTIRYILTRLFRRYVTRWLWSIKMLLFLDDILIQLGNRFDITIFKGNSIMAVIEKR